MKPGQTPKSTAIEGKAGTSTISREILQMLSDHGDSLYGGEAVTQREHALQSAQLAQRDGASAAMVVAALIHDIGHLLHALPSDAPTAGVDDQHEELAAQWLATRFAADVVEPVRLHVAAKRYLCATDPIYFAKLSQPSKLSLKLQGGPMAPHEVSLFLANPYCRDAVNLRRWDDAAKTVHLATPDAASFAPLIDQVQRELAN